jgi:hypothetical protein
MCQVRALYFVLGSLQGFEYLEMSRVALASGLYENGKEQNTKNKVQRTKYKKQNTHEK